MRPNTPVFFQGKQGAEAFPPLLLLEPFSGTPTAFINRFTEVFSPGVVGQAVQPQTICQSRRFPFPALWAQAKRKRETTPWVHATARLAKLCWSKPKALNPGQSGGTAPPRTTPLSAELGLIGWSKRPLPDKLRTACGSRRLLTYLPEDWAEQALGGAPPLPADSRSQMFSSVSRLSKRSRWRDVRQALQAGRWKE